MGHKLKNRRAEQWIDLEVVKRKEGGFKILPHRWVVERDIATSIGMEYFEVKDGAPAKEECSSSKFLKCIHNFLVKKKFNCMMRRKE